MKYIWSAEDIKPGRVVCKMPAYHNLKAFDPECGAHCAYMIGFTNGGGERSNVMISLIDGMVSQPKSKAQVAARLNEDELIPMPHAWLMKTMDYLRDNREYQP